jgi:hypothetical protein
VNEMKLNNEKEKNYFCKTFLLCLFLKYCKMNITKKTILQISFYILSSTIYKKKHQQALKKKAITTTTTTTKYILKK